MEEKKPRELNKKWLLIPLLCAALLASIPSFLSTQQMSRLLCQFLGKRMGGELQIEKLELSWWSKQTIKNASFHSPSYEWSLDQAVIDKSLLKILFQLKGGSSLFIAPRLMLYSPLENSSEQGAPLFFVTDALQVQKGEFALLLAQAGAFSIDHIEASFDKRSEKKELTFFAQTHQGNLEGELQGSGLWGKGDFSIQGKADHLSLASIDSLLGVIHSPGAGLCAAALGSEGSGSFTLHAGSDLFSLSCLWNSPLLELQLTTTQESDRISFENGSFLRWKVIPDFLAKIAQKSSLNTSLSLLSPTTVLCSLNECTLPLRQGSPLLWKELNGDLKIEVAPLDIKLPSLPSTWNFPQMLFHFSAHPLSEALTLQSSLQVRYGASQTGSISLSSVIEDPFFIKANEVKDRFFNSFFLDVNQFPLLLIDDLFNIPDQLLSSALGRSLSLQIKPTEDPTRNQSSWSLSTPCLEMEDLIFSTQESAYLQKPAKFTYTPPPSRTLFAPFSVGKVTGEIDLLVFPVAEPLSTFFKNTMAQLSCNIDTLSCAAPHSVGTVQFGNVSLNINAGSLESIACKASSSLAFEKTSFLDRFLPSNHLDLSINAILDASHLENISAPTCEIDLKSDRLSARFIGSFSDRFTVVHVKEPLHCKLIPSSEALNHFFLKEDGLISFVPFVPFEIQLKPTQLVLDPFTVKNMGFEAVASLNQIDLVNKTWSELFSLKNTSIKLASKIGSDSLFLDLTSYAYEGGQGIGNFHFHGEALHLDAGEEKKYEYVTELDLENFSTHFIDSLIGKRDTLVPLIGRVVNGSALYRHSEARDFYSIDCEGERLQVEGAFSKREEELRLEKPLHFSCAVAPETLDMLRTYNYLTPSSTSYTLSQPVQCEGKFSQFSLPVGAQLSELLTKGLFQGKISWDALHLKSAKTAQEGILSKTTLALNKKTLQDPLHAELKGDLSYKEEQLSKAGKIEILGYVEELDAHQIKTQLTAHVEHLPTLLLDFFLPPFKHPLSLFLGKTLSASFALDLINSSGTLSFTSHSPQIQAKIDSSIQEGILSLNAPAKATLTITPQLASAFLDDLSISFVSAQSPAVLTIEPKNTFFSLKPPSLAKSTISKASLELGQMVCANKGNLSEVGGVFKLSLSPDSLIHLWFSPIQGALRRGVLSLSRTEILFNNAYEIASWGEIDLARSYVDMYVGLTAQSLNKALGLRNLPADFVLPVPMRGPYGNVRFQTDFATARLALLFAREKGLTPKGGPWGTVFDTLGQLAKDQSNVPPARHPFPWEKP